MADASSPNDRQPFDQALEVVARAAGPELVRLLADIAVETELVRVGDTYVTAETDLVFVAGPAAVHIEFQARPDPQMGARMLLYAGLIAQREDVSDLQQIELVVRSRRRTAELRTFRLGGNQAAWLRVPIAALPADGLNGVPGLAPLATAVGTSEADRGERLRQGLRQLLTVPDPTARADLIAAAYVVAQAFLPRTTIVDIFSEERAMSLLEHSELGDLIYNRGREEGRQEGSEQLLRLIERFGDLEALRSLADQHGWNAVLAAGNDATSLDALTRALQTG